MSVNCGWCYGTGTIDAGYETCGSCFGSGRSLSDTNISCWTCGGSGRSSSRRMVTCSYCSGTGVDQAAQRAGNARPRSSSAKRLRQPRGREPKAAKQLGRIDFLAGLASAAAAYIYTLGQTGGVQSTALVVSAVCGVLALYLWKVALVAAGIIFLLIALGEYQK